MKAYLFSYNPLSTMAEVNRLREAIDKDILITDWWHYLAQTYLITSNAEMNILALRLRLYLPTGHAHLIMSVNMKGAGGLLSKDAWDWINHRTLLIR